MTDHSISHILPSQQELYPVEVALDCFEKLKVLLLTVTATDFFEQYADQCSIDHFLALMSDLTEIGFNHLSMSLKSIKSSEEQL